MNLKGNTDLVQTVQKVIPFYKQSCLEVLSEEFIELILGIKEAQNDVFDDKGNRYFTGNYLYKNNQHLTPLVDIKLKDYRHQIKWPDGKPFAACLTHDVDVVNFHNIKQHWRYYKVRRIDPNQNFIHEKDLFKRSLVSLFRRIQGADPAWGFEKWLELEKKFGFRSTFFFMPDKPTKLDKRDPLYRYNDRIKYESSKISVAELMRELDRQGFEIGLHGSFYSYNDSEELKKQKEQVENVLQKEVVSIRQHALHYDILTSPRAQNDAGFLFDTTLGFNEIIGFRFGTSFPFYLYDILNNEVLSIMEIPLHIQDGALLRRDNLNLNAEDAFVQSKVVIDQVAEVGGIVTLLWHPHTVSNNLFPNWFSLYEKLLNYLYRKNAWGSTVKEIGEYWKKEIKRVSMAKQESKK